MRRSAQAAQQAAAREAAARQWGSETRLDALGGLTSSQFEHAAPPLDLGTSSSSRSPIFGGEGMVNRSVPRPGSQQEAEGPALQLGMRRSPSLGSMPPAKSQRVAMEAILEGREACRAGKTGKRSSFDQDSMPA